MDPLLDDNRYHVHDHTGITSCDHQHCHIRPGVTSTPIPRDRTHYHEITGATTYQNRHFHTYRATTSPAIPLPNGYHTHYISFSTSYDAGHRHQIKGFIETIVDEGLHKA
jgi:hypothetical protein